MKQAFIYLFIIMASICHAQTYEQADSAYNQATTENKSLLLIFTGSDWCPHCLRLDKNILKEKSFEDYTSENLVILKADFPQRKKLPKEVIKQNDELADKYNPKGEFPTLLIFNSERTQHFYIEFRNQQPEEFIDELNQKIKLFSEGE